MPWYRVRADRFEASFLPGADEDLDAVRNVDAEVRPADGSRWSTTVFTWGVLRNPADRRLLRFSSVPRVGGAPVPSRRV